MKKITIFLNAYSQGISGADKICIETWKRIRGYQITCITSLGGKKTCEELGLHAKFNITTHEVRFRNPLLTYIARIVISASIALFLPKQQILYSSSDQLPDVIPALVMKCKYFNAKWIVRSYHLIPRKRYISHICQRLSWFFIKVSHATIITASSWMQKELISYGFLPNNIHILFPGISPVQTNSHQYISDEFDAVYLSRLHESKGIYDLINIWRIVLLSKPKAQLGIIGSGEIKIIKKIKHIIFENNLSDSILLLGYLSDQEVKSTISQSKVFVFPSHEEGFSLTIGEVLSYGVPIIAYDLPVYRSIFPDVLTTIPKFDINDFAHSIITLINRPQSVHKKTILGKQLIKKFIWENAIKKELQILRI